MRATLINQKKHMSEKKKIFDLVEIKRRNDIIESKQDEIFDDFKDNLLSYRELAKKYDLTLYDIVKIFNQDKFKDEIVKINEAKANFYVNQITDEIEKIQDESSNSFVAKQRLKVDTLKWLAKTTAPKLFNENYQVAMIRSDQESNQHQQIIVIPASFNKTDDK